jgi:hypothetical protein
VYSKVWEKQGFREESLSLNNLDTLFSKLGRDIQYWIKESKLSGEKNSIVKFLKKIIY